MTCLPIIGDLYSANKRILTMQFKTVKNLNIGL